MYAFFLLLYDVMLPKFVIQIFTVVVMIKLFKKLKQFQPSTEFNTYLLKQNEKGIAMGTWIVAANEGHKFQDPLPHKWK